MAALISVIHSMITVKSSVVDFPTDLAGSTKGSLSMALRTSMALGTWLRVVARKEVSGTIDRRARDVEWIGPRQSVWARIMLW